MRIPQKMYDELGIYDTSELKRYLESISDELKRRRKLNSNSLVQGR